MFESPFKTGDIGKDVSIIFSTIEQWAIGLRRIEARLKITQTENEVLKERIDALSASQAMTILSVSEETEITEDTTTEEI